MICKYINDFYICILKNKYNRKMTIRKTVKQNKKLEKRRKRKILIIFKKGKSTASQKANIQVEVCKGNEQSDFLKR